MFTKNLDHLLEDKKNLLNKKEEISQGDFLKYCLHTLVHLSDHSDPNAPLTSQEEDLLKKLFCFQSYKFDEIDFEPIIRKIKDTHIIGNNLRNADIFLHFKKCRFKSLRLINNYALGIFSAFKIDRKSRIEDLIIAGGFLNNGFSKLSVDDTIIENIQFYGSASKPISFTKVKFRKFLDFRGAVFSSSIHFSECEFGYKTRKNSHINFNNVGFQNTTHIENSEFFSSPKFHGVTFHSDTSFFGTKFLDTHSSDALGDYRALKQGMASIGAEHDEAMFHSLEIESRANTVLPANNDYKNPEYPAKFAANFIMLFNNFGRDYWQPLIWLFITLIVFFLYYHLYSGLECIGKDIPSWISRHCLSTNESTKLSFIYSVKQTLGPIGLFLDASSISPKFSYIKLLGTVQLIISSIMWFMYIVQIRRQFKL